MIDVQCATEYRLCLQEHMSITLTCQLTRRNGRHWNAGPTLSTALSSMILCLSVPISSSNSNILWSLEIILIKTNTEVLEKLARLLYGNCTLACCHEAKVESGDEGGCELHALTNPRQAFRSGGALGQGVAFATARIFNPGALSGAPYVTSHGVQR